MFQNPVTNICIGIICLHNDLITLLISISLLVIFLIYIMLCEFTFLSDTRQRSRKLYTKFGRFEKAIIGIPYIILLCLMIPSMLVLYTGTLTSNLHTRNLLTLNVIGHQ